MDYVVEPEQRDRNVVTVRIPTVRKGWSQKFLLLSDIHFDSQHCSRKLLKKLLDDAVSCGAGIIITGDLFDIMGGRNDRRGSKGSLRSEYKEDGYINKVIDDVVGFLTPYKDNIIFISTGNHECYDQETEVLTDSGWKLFKDLDRTELVATLNMNTEEVEWQRPTAYHVSHHTGKMHQVKTRGANFVVTPNHRIVRRPQSPSGAPLPAYVINRSEELSYSNGALLTIPVSAKSGNPEYPGVSDLELQLLGWVLSDGCVREHARSYSVALYQRPAKLHLITSILDDLGFNYRVETRTRTTESICGRELLQKVSDQHTIYLQNSSRDRVIELLSGKKRIPDWMQELSDRQFEIFLSSFIDGDGSRHISAPESSWMAYGARPMLERLQALCITHGFKASLATYRETDYRLNITRHFDYGLRNVGESFSLVDYDGPVYCATVPNGTLFVRRNGYACISGNSAILKIVEYDLLDTVCRRLCVKRQGYAGFFRLMLSSGNGHRCDRVFYYHHGSAGGEVTHGIVRAQRESAKVHADFYIGGHNHSTWYVEDRYTELNSAGKVVKKTRVHISIPTLKDEHDLFDGYHIEKDRSPRPLGGFWAELYWKPDAETGDNIGYRFYKAD